VNVALWAEIRRLAEIEKLFGWAISRRVHCSRHTVAAALKLNRPLTQETECRVSLLDAHRSKIGTLLAKQPELSAIRGDEEIARSPDGYIGTAYTIRRYLRELRITRSRVYQEVHYKPGRRCAFSWRTSHSTYELTRNRHHSTFS
jgi:hypothetical protein